MAAQRRRPPGRSRRRRRRGVPARPADPRRGPRAGRLPRGDAQPDGALQEAKDGAGHARAPDRRADRPVGIVGHGPGLAEGPELPRPGRPRHGPGRATRSASPTCCRRARTGEPAKGLATTLIMGRIAALLAAAPARRLRATTSTRRIPAGSGREATRPRAIIERMGTVQEVRIAKRTGFCYGVREAIDKAKEAARRGQGDAYPRPGRPQRGRHRATSSARHPDGRHARRRRPRRGGRHPRPRRPPGRHGAGRRTRPRGHRRHLHLGHPGAARAAPGSSRRATRSSCSARRTIPRSSGCSASRRTRSSSTRRRSGSGSRGASGWR